MPLQIMVVHDDPAYREAVSRALREAGYDATAFPDPLAALDALETAACAKVLITRVTFPAGRSNGVSLALMARRRWPGMRVLFVCDPEFRREIADVGEFLAAPAPVSEVVATAGRLMRRVVDAGETAPF
jgi:DNA-binding response OmpR family regulator